MLLFLVIVHAVVLLIGLVFSLAHTMQEIKKYDEPFVPSEPNPQCQYCFGEEEGLFAKDLSAKKKKG